jgi:hypothetical protein
VRVEKSSASLLKEANVGPNLMPWAAAGNDDTMRASTAKMPERTNPRIIVGIFFDGWSAGALAAGDGTTVALRV